MKTYSLYHANKLIAASIDMLQANSIASFLTAQQGQENMDLHIVRYLDDEDNIWRWNKKDKAFALDRASEPPVPSNIKVTVSGLAGVGKSAVAQLIVQALGKKGLNVVADFDGLRTHAELNPVIAALASRVRISVVEQQEPR